MPPTSCWESADNFKWFSTASVTSWREDAVMPWYHNRPPVEASASLSSVTYRNNGLPPSASIQNFNFVVRKWEASSSREAGNDGKQKVIVLLSQFDYGCLHRQKLRIKAHFTDGNLGRFGGFTYIRTYILYRTFVLYYSDISLDHSQLY
jgi:hypothetical protein